MTPQRLAELLHNGAHADNEYGVTMSRLIGAAAEATFGAMRGRATRAEIEYTNALTDALSDFVREPGVCPACVADDAK